jgi:acetyl esterase/lipase
VERIAYGDDPSQFGELWRPSDGTASRDRSPGVAVLVHGGFWRAAHDRRLMAPLARDLAGAGWTVWNLEYRRVGNGGGWPVTLEDVAAGIDRLDGLAGGRVVAVGHSAGGHLAAWAATREVARVRVDAVVAQGAVVDLRAAHALGLSGDAVGDLLGGTPDERPERYDAACPRARLPLGVPALLVHGGRDEVVPPSIARGFAEAARAAGDDVTLHEEPREEHLGHLDPSNPMWKAVRTWL